MKTISKQNGNRYCECVMQKLQQGFLGSLRSEDDVSKLTNQIDTFAK